MHHPYEWNPNKVLNPIKNNTLSRISDNVNSKVSKLHLTLIRWQRLNSTVIFIQNKFAYKDPRARASELLQMNGIKQMDSTKMMNSSSTEQLPPKQIMSNYDIAKPSISYMAPSQSRYKVQL